MRRRELAAVATVALASCPGPAPRLGPGQGLPQVYWVAPRGDDSGPGSRARPWATLQHAAELLGPGERVEIRGGTYRIDTAIAPRRSGTDVGWIEYVAHDRERVVIDASALEVPPPSGDPPFAHDQGAFQLEDVAYVRVEGLTVRNAHQAGFTVRDSHHVALVGNSTDRTFASGIAVWDSQHDDRGTEHIEIRGNTITRANDPRMRPPWAPEEAEPPHEAISIGGALHFEVADNHVHHCGKEGIDVKETSKHGTVHHNHVHHVERQGLYVDAWFDRLADVELAHNHVHHCGGAGVVVSVEGGSVAEDLWIHHNRIHDNDGTGVLFSRWGDDGPRRRVVLEGNHIEHNGHGRPRAGERYFWLTGGIFLYSSNLRRAWIRDNVLVDNRGFQIAVSQRWLDDGATVGGALRQREIVIEDNELRPPPDPEARPIHVGWPPDDYTWAHPVAGNLPP